MSLTLNSCSHRPVTSQVSLAASSFTVFKNYFILNVCVCCSVHVYVCIPYLCLVKVREDDRFPGTGVKGGCALLPCMCWELNQDPLDLQLELLTMQPSLSPLF